MSTIGQPERATQNRVVALVRDELRYRYPGPTGNSNIEEELLSAWLKAAMMNGNTDGFDGGSTV